MLSNTHYELIDKLRKAWIDLDATLIEPLLANSLHYYSWWALVELNSKEEYLKYIRERFLAYKRSGTHPIVKIGINKNDGEYAVALQLGDDVPTLIRIKEENGKIKEMWMQPAD